LLLQVPAPHTGTLNATLLGFFLLAVSSQYHPSCDGEDSACAVSRVFASVQAGLSGDASSEASNGIDRTAEAQRCGM
jgi:hypothetical protein